MNSTDVLKTIENARVNGDFDLVKRLSKQELENPQSDVDPQSIMDQIAHMYLDSFLVWVNEMKKIDRPLNKYNALRAIAQDLEDNPKTQVFYTQYMKEMIAADAEEVRNIFLSVDDDDDDEGARQDGRGIL